MKSIKFSIRNIVIFSFIWIPLILSAHGCSAQNEVPGDTETLTPAIKATPIIPEQNSLVDIPDLTGLKQNNQSSDICIPDEIPTQMALIDPKEIPLDSSSDSHILKISYIDSEQNLWYWQENSSLNRLTDSNDVVRIWMNQAGDAIAFTRQDDSGKISLWSIHNDGTNELLLVSSEIFFTMLDPQYADAYGAVPEKVTWIGNTSILAFNTAPIYEIGTVLNNDLWLVDTNSAEIHSVLAPGEGGHYLFSPDFTQIAIIKPDRICLVNSDGSNRRSGVVRYDLIMTYSEWMYYPQPVWSSDSNHLHVAIPDSEPVSMLERTYTTWNIPTNGDNGNQLGKIQSSINFWWEEISPDLSKILYQGPSTGDLVAIGILQVSDIDGSNTITYDSGFVSDFGWLPDSARFYYIRQTTGEVYLADSQAANSEHLDETENILQFQWIDDQRYLYLQEQASKWVITLHDGDKSQEIATIEKMGTDESYRPSFEFVE